MKGGPGSVVILENVIMELGKMLTNILGIFECSQQKWRGRTDWNRFDSRVALSALNSFNIAS